MTYTPTTDEVDTGFTEFAYRLERESPGSYGENSGFEDYSEVCAGFRRWYAEEIRRAKEEAYEEGVEANSNNFEMTWLLLDGNPYRRIG